MLKEYLQTFQNVVSSLVITDDNENVFSKQLETLLTTGDILIAVSSSGKSNNIINAAGTASQKEIFLITLSGFSEDNSLRKSGDINLWIHSGNYGIVEIGHALLLHFITDFYSENSLFV